MIAVPTLVCVTRVLIWVRHIAFTATFPDTTPTGSLASSSHIFLSFLGSRHSARTPTS